jgi:hypothetical protein
MFVLHRTLLTGQYTMGELHVEGELIGYTLEDPVRELMIGGRWKWDRTMKIPGKTAIPSGTYPITVTLSHRFGIRLPLLSNVRDFTAIRIHGGNSASDTEGCILVGKEQRIDKGWIGNCKPAVDRCIEIIELLREFGTPTIEIYNYKQG